MILLLIILKYWTKIYLLAIVKKKKIYAFEILFIEQVALVAIFYY